jgi:hypothetical protein
MGKMSKIDYFRDQAERAERLAKTIMDTLTVEKLRAFAAECRSQVEALSKDEHSAAAWGTHPFDVGCRIIDLRAGRAALEDQEPIGGSPVFSAMRVPEENCNVVLLAAVSLLSAVVALAVNWFGGPQTVSAKPPVHVAERAPVRVVGTPFVPNVNPGARQ